MDNILLTDVPRLPPGSQPRAIVLGCNYSYNNKDAQVPERLRDTIPARFKKDGIFYLFKNEEGILYQRSPGDGRWGVAFVIRDGYQLHFVVPMKYAIRGAAFRPLVDKLADHYPTSDPSFAGNLSPPVSGPLLDRFIRSMWIYAAQNQEQFAQLGMPQQQSDSLFSAQHFEKNMNGILAGLLPGVYATIREGNFTVNDLIRLPKVSQTWPGPGHGLYLRIYADLQNPSGSDVSAALYIGQSKISIWKRHSDHERETEVGSGTLHYRIAAKALPENRHTIPLALWGDEAIARYGEHVLDLAEQTMLLVFATYHPTIHTTAKLANTQMVQTAEKGSFLYGLARKAREFTGWKPVPNLRYVGCNIMSPVFTHFGGCRMNCFRMRSPDPATRTYTTYRTQSSIMYNQDWPSVRLSAYRGDADKMVPFLFTLKKSLFSKSVSKGYPVFEIMDDGRPHNKPYFGVPNVETYENFDRASSIGV